MTVVQQEHGLEFNRGLMKNIGYSLSKNACDYICFHDVDYLPIWADYSEPNGFAPIVWYGAEQNTDHAKSPLHITSNFSSAGSCYFEMVILKR